MYPSMEESNRIASKRIESIACGYFKKELDRMLNAEEVEAEVLVGYNGLTKADQEKWKESQWEDSDKESWYGVVREKESTMTVLGIQFDIDSVSSDVIVQGIRRCQINPSIPTEYQNVGRRVEVFVGTLRKLLECIDQLNEFDERVMLVKLIYSYISTDINLLLQYPRLYTAVRERIEVCSGECVELLPYLNFFCGCTARKHERDVV